jgi:hypothetical protein
MSINNEIKRMMSLLESEMGDVKPLLNEQGDPQTPPVEASKSPLERSIATGCWTNKRATTDGKIYTLGKGYVYAFAKIAPEIQAGDKFLKVTTADGTNLYVFEKPSTDPAALSIQPNAYLAVTRNKDVQQDKTKPDPNLNYLTSHGWYCNEFETTKGAATQETQMTQDQVNVVNTLSTDEFIKRVGGKIYTTKAFGDNVNYQTIDLATGKDVVTGEQLFNAQDMAVLKDAKFSPAGKYFVYKVAGTNTSRTNVSEAVESALKYLGYTSQEPSGVLGAQANSETTVGELCDTILRGRCNSTILDYKEKNPNLKIWMMSKAQKDEFEQQTKIKVFDQKSMVSGVGASKGELRRGAKESKSQFANRKFCNTGIDILTYCSTYSTLKDTSRCEGYMEDLDSRGAIKFPDPAAPFEGKIMALKNLLKDCAIGVQKGEINIAKKYEAPFLELQRSSGPYGMRTEGPKPTNANTTNRGGMSESLNDSIKSVITETINKNNNKNLDSIIKKNLRKYIG